MDSHGNALNMSAAIIWPAWSKIKLPLLGHWYKDTCPVNKYIKIENVLKYTKKNPPT